LVSKTQTALEISGISALVAMIFSDRGAMASGSGPGGCQETQG
jgi:hypothetical protein